MLIVYLYCIILISERKGYGWNGPRLVNLAKSRPPRSPALINTRQLRPARAERSRRVNFLRTATVSKSGRCPRSGRASLDATAGELFGEGGRGRRVSLGGCRWATRSSVRGVLAARQIPRGRGVPADPCAQSRSGTGGWFC